MSTGPARTNVQQAIEDLRRQQAQLALRSRQQQMQDDAASEHAGDLYRVGSPGALIGEDAQALGPYGQNLYGPNPSIQTTPAGRRSQGFGRVDAGERKWPRPVGGGLEATSVHPDAGNMANMLPLMHSAGVPITYGSGPFQTNVPTYQLTGLTGNTQPRHPGSSYINQGGSMVASIGGPATAQALARMGGAAPPTFRPGSSRGSTGQVT